MPDLKGYYCTECRTRFAVDGNSLAWQSKVTMDFCPVCGSRRITPIRYPEDFNTEPPAKTEQQTDGNGHKHDDYTSALWRAVRVASGYLQTMKHALTSARKALTGEAHPTGTPDFLETMAKRFVDVYGDREYCDHVGSLRVRANEMRDAIGTVNDALSDYAAGAWTCPVVIDAPEHAKTPERKLTPEDVTNLTDRLGRVEQLVGWMEAQLPPMDDRPDV